jgi:hypothetical protein
VRKQEDEAAHAEELHEQHLVRIYTVRQKSR